MPGGTSSECRVQSSSARARTSLSAPVMGERGDEPRCPADDRADAEAEHCARLSRHLGRGQWRSSGSPAQGSAGKDSLRNGTSAADPALNAATERRCSGVTSPGMFVETIDLPREEWERWHECLRYSTDPPESL